MADYTYDAKNLPAGNYPLRKVQSFVRKTTPKFLRPLHDAVDKPILNAVEPLAEEYKQYKPQAGTPIPGSAEDAIKKAYSQNLNVAQPPGMRRGGHVKKYAAGGSTAKPPRSNMSPAELNDWRAGQDEVEMRDEIAKKTKPVVKPKPPVKMARGGSVSSRADGCCTKGKTKGRFV